MDNDSFNISEFVKELVSIAKADGHISIDEENLISSMETQISKYWAEIQKSLEDGIITREEKLKLENTRMNLIREIFDTVLEDLEVTADEQLLMDEFMNKLQHLTKYEEK